MPENQSNVNADEFTRFFFVAFLAPTGKFFGVIAVIEFLVLLISSSVFSVIYKKTLAYFPPTVFLIGTAICLIVCYPLLM